MAREIRNRFQAWLAAAGASDPQRGLILSDTLQPVVMLDHGRSMVPPASGRFFGAGPPIAAVAARRGAAIWEFKSDVCITNISASVESHATLFPNSVLAALRSLLTTQSGSEIGSLGPDGDYAPKTVMTYGTTTQAGDDGLAIMPGTSGQLGMNIYAKAGDGLWMIHNTVNVAVTYGLAWVEFPINDMDAQSHIQT